MYIFGQQLYKCYFLFFSGLSFRTTEESLRNAFKNFGQLVEGRKMMIFSFVNHVFFTKI